MASQVCSTRLFLLQSAAGSLRDLPRLRHRFPTEPRGPLLPRFRLSLSRTLWPQRTWRQCPSRHLHAYLLRHEPTKTRQTYRATSVALNQHEANTNGMTLCTTLVARTFLDRSTPIQPPHLLKQPAKVSTLPIKHQACPSMGFDQDKPHRACRPGRTRAVRGDKGRAVSEEDAEQEQRTRTCRSGKSLPGQAAW